MNDSGIEIIIPANITQTDTSKAKGFKKGYDFEREVLKSLEVLKAKNLPHIWYYKLVDTYAYDWVKDAIALQPKEVVKTWQHKHELILPKVPSDIDFVYKGRSAKFECKSTINDYGFCPKEPYIKQHQLEASKDLEDAGIPYYFFICNRSVPRHHKLYVVRGFKMRVILKQLEENKKARIKWEALEDLSECVLPKAKGGIYDLSFLITNKNAMEVAHGND